MDTNSASSRDVESGFGFGKETSYLFLLFFAFESATLTVLGVVSQSAAISFGVSPARDNRLARSVRDDVSGLMLSARSLMRTSILFSIRLISVSVTC